KIPPNSTILTPRPVTSIMNDTSRLDSYKTFSTPYNSKDNSISPKILINPPLNTSIYEPQLHLAREYVFPRFAQKNLRQQQEKIKGLRSRSRVQIKRNKSSSNLGIMEEEEVLPIAACKVPYSIVNSISNKDADITCGQLLTIKNNGSNKVSKGEEVDNYYFGEYNSTSENLVGKLSFGKDMDKKVPYKIDVKMSEPSEEGKGIETIGLKKKGISENEDIDEDKNDDCWDSDNETVVEDYKKSVEVENVCNKVWEERVAALVGKKKKKIFHSQEALDEVCEAWLEK
ncbi:24573_t:CDS:1, partial [Gigaspora margarita]